MTRRDVFYESIRIVRSQLPDHLPEARARTRSLIECALRAVGDRWHPITDWERLQFKRAIQAFAEGHYYRAADWVAHAMFPEERRPAMPFRPDQMRDFEPLSADELHQRFRECDTAA
jgi:hypothetical protein